MTDRFSELMAIPIAVRGYIKRAKGATGSQRERSFEPYSPWTLVLDTETDTVDLPAAQPLLIVQYRIYWEDQLFQRGVAYDPETAWPEEVKTIHGFCLRHKYYCLTANKFRALFYWFGFDLQATIVGANLFFDISRLAVWHGRARTSMYGGFSFRLLRESGYPNIRAKKLTDIAYKFDFAGPPAPPAKDARRFQEARPRLQPMRGTFVDVLVLGKALLGEGRPSLASLGKKLQVRHPS